MATKKDKDKLVTIGVPAYKAQKTLPMLLASVLFQTDYQKTKVIIANDWPEDNGSYDFLIDHYPDLDIKILSCEKNTGPGLARQRALDACDTDWITFMDADDTFLNNTAIENLVNNITPNCIEVQGPFYADVEEGKMTITEKKALENSNAKIPPRMIARNEVTHPWVFGRLYNVKFLKQSKIKFSSLRAINNLCGIA